VAAASPTPLGCRTQQKLTAERPQDPLMPLTAALEAAIGTTAAARLRIAIARWSEGWSLPDLPEAVVVDLNRRLRTRVGRYCHDGHRIEVGPRFLSLRSRRAEVLAHELAHAAARRLHPRARKPHGPEWKSLIRAAGFEPMVRLRVSATPKTVTGSGETARYRHRCPVCQMTRWSRKPVPAWRCRSCAAAGLPGVLVINRVGVRQ
jgi:predicted SprT family Zn-dependent metalloprotease